MRRELEGPGPPIAGHRRSLSLSLVHLIKLRREGRVRLTTPPTHRFLTTSLWHPSPLLVYTTHHASTHQAFDKPAHHSSPLQQQQQKLNAN
ncbi:hypothetical protein Pcinc_036161 [Petrolisthes cinctipes]|uniref:Uncharacterized protein n=1 Tax=Petrolisthes cinctipes TaxID=88211 RepID=A0AAE1BYC7_PETCI|nr:hypothetical protein Pcinc_036161 [Petrolisthes cinctipes]